MPAVQRCCSAPGAAKWWLTLRDTAATVRRMPTSAVTAGTVCLPAQKHGPARLLLVSKLSAHLRQWRICCLEQCSANEVNVAKL